MKRYAQIDNGQVTATIDNLPPLVPTGRTFVDVTDLPDAQIGSLYVKATKTFTPPAPGTAAGPSPLEVIQADLRAIKAKIGI